MSQDAIFEAWEEHKHPRDADGKFTSTGVSSSNKKISNSISNQLSKSNIPDDVERNILAPFSRTTDPNSSVGNFSIKQAWDTAKQINPNLEKTQQQLEDYEKNVNQQIQKEYESSKSLYRGMRSNELDSAIEKGGFEPYNYNFISFTLDKSAGMGFGRNAGGLTVEFDKDNIESQKLWNGEDMIIQPVNYSVYQDHVGVGEELEGSYPISYADEVEVRSVQFQLKDTIKSITIHKDEYDDANEINEQLERYSKIFPNADVSIKDSSIRESKNIDAINEIELNGSESTSDITNTNFIPVFDDWLPLTGELDLKAGVDPLQVFDSGIPNSLTLDQTIETPSFTESFDIGATTGGSPSMHGEEPWNVHKEIPGIPENYDTPAPATRITNNVREIWNTMSVDARLNALQQVGLTDNTIQLAIQAFDGLDNQTKTQLSLLYPMEQNNIRSFQEALQGLRTEFKWLDEPFIEKAHAMAKKAKARLLLIRAAAETITDHRGEGEPYRRLLSSDELHALTRTGIGKKSDINHYGPEYQTEGITLDAEFDKERQESQFIHMESDPEIIKAIEDGVISAVSINAGGPRRMPTGDCNDGSGETCLIPEGLILGEYDGIGFTYVVTDPKGMTWRGKKIPTASPGIKVTKIEML